MGVPLGGLSFTTLYFNDNWKKTVKDSAKYYRLSKSENGLFKVEDHFMNGQLQMNGSYKTLNPEVKEGDFVYYGKDGVKES